MDTIVMTRGDDRTIDVTVTDKDGAAVNLNTVTALWFTVKSKVTDVDDSAMIRKTLGAGITVVSAPAGTAKIAIDAADTRNWPGKRGQTFFWDLQGKDNSGKIITLDRGVFVLTADVTRAYS